MYIKGSKVVRSREWHKPKTEINISALGISESVSLEDFLKAVMVELGSIALTFRQETFEKQLDRAVTEVLKKL